MRTPRLLLLFLTLGVVALLAVQNISPALPLVFLGLQTPAFPLAFWLVGAIALGSLSSLLLASLISPRALGTGGSRRMPNRSGRRIPDEPDGPSHPADSRSRPQDDSAARGEWGEWTNLQSPTQWDDWEQTGQPRNAEPKPTANRPFWGRKREEEQAQQVNESWQELADGWEDLEDVRYRPRGVSPVSDALDDLEEGWGEPRRQQSESNASRRVYQDGSIYSYSYREPDGSEQSRTDNIYDSEDEDDNWVDAPEDDFEEEDLENVVDADYRVIIPPYPSTDPPDTHNEDDGNWIDRPPKR